MEKEMIKEIVREMILDGEIVIKLGTQNNGYMNNEGCLHLAVANPISTEDFEKAADKEAIPVWFEQEEGLGVGVRDIVRGI